MAHPAVVVGAGLLTTGVFLRAARAAVRAKRGEGLTRRFDPIFSAHCGAIPVAYLRALAKSESNFDAEDTRGPAHGLMQITEVLRRDFNQRNGTDISREDLLDPSVNVRIACDLLRRIARLYESRHPRTFPGGFDFGSARQVGLLTYGWNAGFSERNGVGFAIGELERQGKPASGITPDAVHALAHQDPRVVRFIRERPPSRFVDKVVTLYFRERNRSRV